jgi:hypothetical protein
MDPTVVGLANGGVGNSSTSRVSGFPAPDRPQCASRFRRAPDRGQLRDPQTFAGGALARQRGHASCPLHSDLRLWLNHAEICFNRITQRAIRRGTFRSVKELVTKIDQFVQNGNRNAQPFIWTATAAGRQSTDRKMGFRPSQGGSFPESRQLLASLACVSPSLQFLIHCDHFVTAMSWTHRTISQMSQ